MAADPNLRSLPQVLAIAKAIIKAGKEGEFIAESRDKENLFVVSTESARLFMAEFLRRNNIDPSGADIPSFSYGNDRCS